MDTKKDVTPSQKRQGHVMTKSDKEPQIRALMDKFTEAVRKRDIDGILALYASDAMIYDVRDSLECKKEDLRKTWQECFDVTKKFSLEIRKPQIFVDENIAFVHCLSHATGQPLEGGTVDVWMRVTSCLKKIDDKWLVIHEHVSVPGDFTSGKILQDLKPDQKTQKH